MPTYFSTEDAALYLDIKERKLYELVSQGQIPCSKVTGKWLFPRAALDRWVEAGMAHPEGFSPASPPAIIGGSHDPLLEWAVRHSGSGLAMLSEGSASGLKRLDKNEVALAAIHLHDMQDANTNIAALTAASHLHDAVLVAFACREQGLIVGAGNPLKLSGLEDAVAKNVRFGLRQEGAGAQLLLEVLLNKIGKSIADLTVAPGTFATAQDLAFALRAGDIACGIGTRAVAAINGLDFVPLIWESFDLALRRRTYFEPGAQKLFALMREPEFHRHALLLGGYDTHDSGMIRLNR